MLLKNRKHYKSKLPIGTGSVVKKLWENKLPEKPHHISKNASICWTGYFLNGAKGFIIYGCTDVIWSTIYCLCREMNMLLKNRKHYKK